MQISFFKFCNQSAPPFARQSNCAPGKGLAGNALHLALLSVLLIIASPLKAENLDVCVICNSPNKVYQCTYQSPAGYELNLNLKGLQFACIKEIAQYGEHGQCAAARNQQTNCNGEAYLLRNTAGLYKPLATEETAETPEITEQPGKKQPTLVDETSKTYENTKETVKKGYDKTKETVNKGYNKTTKTVKSVGKTIKDAASTTYDCIASFFSDC